MSGTKFAHHNKKGTLAIELPTKEFFEHMRNDYGTTAILNMGLSFCSIKDPFVKKVGRELAQERVCVQACHLRAIEVRPLADTIAQIYHFELEKLKKMVRFGISVTEKNINTRLVYMEVL